MTTIALRREQVDVKEHATATDLIDYLHTLPDQVEINWEAARFTADTLTDLRFKTTVIGLAGDVTVTVHIETETT